MKVLGLTGGVGMGKSACADLLRARGVPVVDTDDLARQVVEPGQPGLEEVRRLFPQVFGPDGRLRRDQLARRVFSDATARRQLEGILHPQIRQLWRRQMERWRSEGHALAVVVIPLLFETNAQEEVDRVICVACSPATQEQRLLARGWSADECVRRIAAQWPIENKLALAHFVIWTEGGLELHAAQLYRILDSAGLTTATPGA
jgi:dephospho-CoA kinase